jgi:hypothetical protein
MWRSCLVVGVALASGAVAQSQFGVAPSSTTSVSPRSVYQPPRPPALISIAVPYDPSEIVTGNAQPVQDAEERAAAMQLLLTAQRLSNVRQHAYDLKTTFTSYGSSASDGRWVLEDTSPSPFIYRWTAEGPSFSGVFLSVDRLLSSNEPGGAVPLRLAQVRSAIFGVYGQPLGPYASLRVANGYANGIDVRCVLLARGISTRNPPQYANGRSFEESEYCVNPRTGLLAIYSPYPGLYIHFDYADQLKFHEMIIPGSFTISEAGKTIIEAKTESVQDSLPKTSNIFEPSGLRAIGAGIVAEVPTVLRNTFFVPDDSGNGRTDVVVVHGILTPEGALRETEVLVSTNSALDETALDHAAKSPILEASTRDEQPGVVPHPREIVFTEEFVPRALPPCPPNANFPGVGVVCKAVN